MPNFAVTHFDARHKCCCISYRKADRILSVRDLILIKALVLPNYYNDNQSFATGICTTCNRVLLLHGKPYVGTTPRSLQIHPLAASGVVLSVLTRSKNVCHCTICKVVKSTKPGTKRTKPEGRPRILEKPTNKMPITICNQCFQSIDSLRGYTCTKVFWLNKPSSDD